MLNFKNWLLSERTLYHGTVVDNIKAIRQFGLLPYIGKFVQDAYGDDIDTVVSAGEDLELIFAADKQGIGKALTAMVHHVGEKLNKGFHDVTDNDIRNHGLLLKIHDGGMEHRPEDDENYYGQHPMTVEPGDYYSRDRLGVDEFVTGAGLLRLLKRNGALPRNWGPGAEKTSRQALIHQAVVHHGPADRQKVVQHVDALPPNKRQSYLDRYKTLNKDQDAAIRGIRGSEAA